MVSKGSVVVKLNGRFAGYPAVVLENLDNNYVKLGIILNEKVMKEKKSNIKHILPLPYKVDESKLNDIGAIVSEVKEIEWGKRIKV